MYMGSFYIRFLFLRGYKRKQKWPFYFFIIVFRSAGVCKERKEPKLSPEFPEEQLTPFTILLSHLSEWAYFRWDHFIIRNDHGDVDFARMRYTMKLSRGIPRCKCSMPQILIVQTIDDLKAKLAHITPQRDSITRLIAERLRY